MALPKLKVTITLQTDTYNASRAVELATAAMKAASDVKVGTDGLRAVGVAVK